MTRDEWIVVRFDATPDVDDMCDLGEIAPQRDLDQHEDDDFASDDCDSDYINPHESLAGGGPTLPKLDPDSRFDFKSPPAGYHVIKTPDGYFMRPKNGQKLESNGQVVKCWQVYNSAEWSDEEIINDR